MAEFKSLEELSVFKPVLIDFKICCNCMLFLDGDFELKALLII